jgi:transcriptional regulator NrdR family protein
MADKEGGTLRRRHCNGCGYRFYALQEPEYEIPSWVIDWAGAGRHQPFLDRSALTTVKELEELKNTSSQRRTANV